MKKLYILLFITAYIGTVSAQTIFDNNPPSVRWYQINTPHFNILFPSGFDDQAQRMANTLEHLHGPASKTLGGRPPRISVLLQNRSSESNAFVSLTPRRSEFYTMPSQDYNFIGNNDWLDLIATHEFRHVVQYHHANQGFNKFVNFLFGNFGLSVMANAAAPKWFWEGDAVAIETAFTPTGRGRIPNFGLVFRTNLLEGREFNYHKQYLRSYKHNIPNEYVLGYHMISYLRKRTDDPMIWSKITERAWKSSIVPFTFSSAIKKETGLHVTDLYNEMVKDLSQEWKQVTDTMTLTAFNRINTRRSKAYTDYLYPHTLEDGGIVALKRGIGDIDQLVLLKGGDEKKVFVQGIVNETGMISVAGSKVVWNEYRFDPRWRVQTYSTIMEYDIIKKKKRTLASSRARYAGAALSHDAKQVVTVRSDVQYKHQLVVLDAESGSIVKEIPNPENSFYSMPRWSPDGKKIVTLETKPEGKAVVLVNLEDGSSADLIPAGGENIGYPLLHQDYLLYNSPISGIDNIYALDLKTGKRYSITSSKYGAYNPSVSTSGNSIFYNEQSRDGLDIVRIPFDPESWRPVVDEVQPTKPLYEFVVDQEDHSPVTENIPQQNYPTRKYRKTSGLINPYSWGVYMDNTLAQADIGIQSRDILSTTSIGAGYKYDIFENSGAWYGSVSYQGLYPILNASVSYGNRIEDTGVFGRDVRFEWKETDFSVGAMIPLILTKSKYLTSLNISNTLGFTLTSGFSNSVSLNGEVIFEGVDRYVPANDTLFYLFNSITDFGQLVYNHFSINYNRSLKQSRRDFNPAFGQFLTFEHFSTPFGGDYTGWQWAARGSLYFPGLAKHHSVFFRGGYQESLESFELDVYGFRNRLFKPRGYSYPRNTKFTTLSANYALPIWYPDINLGPVLNLQRIRASVFYDYGIGEGLQHFYNFENGRIYLGDNGETYQSYGAEVTVDFNLFRLFPQFEMGIRISKPTANNYSTGGLMYELLIGNIPF